jgi:hypothetical protein
MPAIDLARLRKQANRLADFFFLPDEFMKHLREMLEFYVNHTLRTKENIAPGSNLITYRTPPVVLRHIENELRELAAKNPEYALEIADLLWDEDALETRLLSAFLLGRIPPQEEHLLPRITAWIQQVRDPSVRSALLTISLTRMRKETPIQFLGLIQELLHPARSRTWSNGIQALLAMIADVKFENFPPILDLVEPIIQAAPSTLQTDLENLILELYKASPSETTFFLKQILGASENEMTFISMRRIAPSLPSTLQAELKDYLRRPTPLSRPKAPKIEEPEEGFVSEPEKIIEPEPVMEEAKAKPKKSRRSGTDNKPKSSPKDKT